MAHLISAADRAAFKRCRRQWDFTAATRQGLHPLEKATVDLDRAVRDALAIYYFPGMWDWESAIVLPLVVQALDDSLDRQRPPSDSDEAEWQAQRDAGHLLLERYFSWAPTVDLFSPVRVETDFDAIVPDPADPDFGLLAPDGGEFRYTGRMDLLALDEHDRYWVVRHRVIDGALPPTEHLLLDEEAVAACWAWERFYDGMEVAGTIFNELAATAPADGDAVTATPTSLSDHPRGGIPQSDASGGGREVSSLRRMYVKGRPEETTERIRQTDADGFRRTVIRRGPPEVQAAGLRLAQESLDMISAGDRSYPNPAPDNCSTCAFVAPCLATDEGSDVESLLTASYGKRRASDVEMGRLGGTPYGVGRGWALGPGGQGPSPAD